MNDSVLELPARGHGIEALAKSALTARDRLGIASVSGALDARDQSHALRP
jgi:hypothetical protein